MGYYENPPMVQSSRAGNIMAESITRAADSVSQGIMQAGERKRQQEKELKLTIQKLQDQKNQTDLFYSEKLSKWSSENKSTNKDLDNKVYDIIDSKLKLAADSRISLLSETDKEKRNELLSNVTNAERFLENSASFMKTVAMDTATWRTNAKASKIGVPGGYVINGETDEQIIDNTAVVEILGGMDSMYEDPNIDISQDENGDGVLLNVSGKHKDGRAFNVTINSKDYLNSDESGNGGLLLSVEGITDFQDDVMKDIVNKKGEVLNGYLSSVTETVDIPSKGGDIYQLKNAQRIEDKAIKSAIKTKSDVRASGILASYNPSSLRTLIDYTLGNGPGYYDKNFKTVTNVDQQKQMLSSMFTEKTFYDMTKEFKTTKDKDGNTIYWNPTADIDIKPKTKPTAPKEVKEKPSSYKEQYFDDIIVGGDNTNETLVTSLNRMSKPGTFTTRDKLFDRWKKQKYKSGKYVSKKTIEEQYASGDMGETAEQAFEKLYPTSKGSVYQKTAQNMYVPVGNYDINKAEDRVKLALDQSGVSASESKILQSKIQDARLKDWTEANPRKQNESLQDYTKRAIRAGINLN